VHVLLRELRISFKRRLVSFTMPDSLFGDSDSEEYALDHPAASTNSISPPRSSFANDLNCTTAVKGLTAIERCQDDFQIVSGLLQILLVQ